MNRTVILRLLGLVVVVAAVAAGGLFGWRYLHRGSAPKTVAKKAPATPRPLPPNAPKISTDMDPIAIDPFVRRLARVNTLAHKMIVTNAEYHDTDGGQRYWTAVVTSCKDLNALWPIKRGVLDAKVETPLGLKTDFPIFAFVEYSSSGQWGVAPCDNTT
jgi:hypothetical protein